MCCIGIMINNNYVVVGGAYVFDCQQRLSISKYTWSSWCEVFDPGEPRRNHKNLSQSCLHNYGRVAPGFELRNNCTQVQNSEHLSQLKNFRQKDLTCRYVALIQRSSEVHNWYRTRHPKLRTTLGQPIPIIILYLKNVK